MADEQRGSPHNHTIASLTRRLLRYAQGLGLDEPEIRQIVEAIIAAMPDAEDLDQLTVARKWILQAAR